MDHSERAFELGSSNGLMDRPRCLFCGEDIDPQGADYRGACPKGNAAMMYRLPHGRLIGYICPDCLGAKDGFDERLREGLRRGASRLRALADELEGWANLPPPNELSRRRAARRRSGKGEK